MAKKFYAVRRGRAPGIYTAWADCKAQVDGFAGARYKGFMTREEAAAWLAGETGDKPAPRRKAASKPRKPVAGTNSSCAPQDADAGADYIIYTDGSCLVNPEGPGGWAVVTRDVATGKLTERSGGAPSTTNNRMELTAAIEALSRTPAGSVVALHTDSQYLINGITKWVAGWKRRGWQRASGEPVLNPDLWQRLDQLTAAREVRFVWVRGHVGNPLNERCDTLAKQAASRFS